MGTLTALKIKTLAKGTHNDGNGLYLRTSAKGSGSWFLRTRVHGDKVDIGLGSLKLVSLADARAMAAEKRAVARRGGDPRVDRSRRVPTFREAAMLVHTQQIEPESKNAKHRAQWLNTLETYACPFIGDRSVDKVEQSDILKILQPIWLTKPETARRVRQRLRTVFAWARTAGHREAANPVEDIESGLAKQKDKANHFAALDHSEVPAFMSALEAKATLSALALRFTILTCARSGEVREATWSEMDIDKGLWTIPASRMKAKVEHRVPLTTEALSILEQVRGRHSELVFPGTKPGRPMSDMTLTALLKRMGRTDITVHGFRSTFRDWVSEATEFPGELAEHCLAHKVGGAVQRAYARSDMLEKRRRLLADWEAFCLTERAV